ncbi:hypothetical protein [Entomohabitans teleogrylli]|uniref:hypothetical protein n=1 Tax=Entomohabitans teleogrylli TaxID=1384589 RepID=UPI000B019344|nr:hypothetical protein [Entomohabitans teleogrylli]
MKSFRFLSITIQLQHIDIKRKYKNKAPKKAPQNPNNAEHSHQRITSISHHVADDYINQNKESDI